MQDFRFLTLWAVPHKIPGVVCHHVLVLVESFSLPFTAISQIISKSVEMADKNFIAHVRTEFFYSCQYFLHKFSVICCFVIAKKCIYNILKRIPYTQLIPIHMVGKIGISRQHTNLVHNKNTSFCLTVLEVD